MTPQGSPRRELSPRGRRAGRAAIVTRGSRSATASCSTSTASRIKGESSGSLTEIAGVLTEAADVRIVIVGRRFGRRPAANLDLSRRRTAAVKAELVSEFRIDAARMDGEDKAKASR